MILLNAFLQSLRLPSKHAVFTLNRIGMDVTVLYMFIVMGIVAVPALLDRVTDTGIPGSDMALFFQLIYFFMFYYLPLTILVFIALSIVAYLFTWLARLFKRKLRFPLLWKMGAYATTIPFLLYSVIALLFSFDDTMLWVFFIYSICVLFKVIMVYPKRKKQTR